MTESLRVAFKLLDQVTPALRQMDQGLVGTVRSLKDVDAALKKVGRGELRQSIAAQTDPLKKYRAALSLVREELQEAERSSFGGQLAALGSAAAGPWALVAGAVAAATAALTAGTLAVAGFAIKWAAFRRDNLMALELITGSTAGAGVAYERLAKLADKTPFPTEDIIEFGKELLSAQFTLKETEDILAGVADAAAVQGSRGGEAARSLLSGIAKIRGRDALNMETIEQVVTGGGAAGVNLGNLLQTLAAARGTTVEAVRQAIGAGQVKGNDGIRAILTTIERVTDKGGPLGTATQLFGTRSLSGQISTFQSRLRGLFTEIDIGPLVDVLRRVNDLLSSDSAIGKSVRVFANDLFGKAFKGIGTMFSEANLTALLDGTAKALQTVGGIFEGLGHVAGAFFEGLFGGFDAVPGNANPVQDVLEHLKSLVDGQSAADWRLYGEAIGSVAKALGLLLKAGLLVERMLRSALRVPGFGEILEKLRAPDVTPTGAPSATPLTAPSPLVASLGDLGRMAAMAFGGGLASSVGQSFTGGASVGDAAANGVRDALDIHSPSRVMKRAGEMTGEGFSLGLRESDADRDLQTFLGGDGGGRPAPGGTGRSARALTVTFGDIVIHGAASGDRPQDFAQAIRRELLLALEDFALST